MKLVDIDEIGTCKTCYIKAEYERVGMTCHLCDDGDYYEADKSLFDIIDIGSVLDKLIQENDDLKLKVLQTESELADVAEMLCCAVSDLHQHHDCAQCKYFDRSKSVNYGWTEECKKCGDYPWNPDDWDTIWDWRGTGYGE